MNILFSSDDNYAPHLGAAIYSLLLHNQWCDRIAIYIVDNGISKTNIDKLLCFSAEFANASIFFIDFSKWKGRLHLNLEWQISLSSYARLFVGSMLPISVLRIIYLDCDVIVSSSLEALWNASLNSNVIGAIQDDVPDETKTAIGKKFDSPYFNAGVLLIDLEQWRENDYESKCMAFIKKYNGSVRHHDQGVLNGVFDNCWTRLPIRYNLMTLHYLKKRDWILHFYKEHASFYDEQEIIEAKQSPAIIHYTPSFTSRPWVKGCKHPKLYLYWEMIRHTPWKNNIPQKDNTRWYVKLINWRFRVLGF